MSIFLKILCNGNMRSRILNAWPNGWNVQPYLIECGCMFIYFKIFWKYFVNCACSRALRRMAACFKYAVEYSKCVSHGTYRQVIKSFIEDFSSEHILFDLGTSEYFKWCAYKRWHADIDRRLLSSLIEQ